jgi:hypothetical protein
VALSTPFQGKRQAHSPAYRRLLETSATSLNQWISFTFLSWGIFASWSLKDACMNLLRLRAIGVLIPISIILELSTGLTSALLVVLFMFVVRWHVVKRVEQLPI